MQRVHRTGLVVLAAIVVAAAIALGSTHHLSFPAAKLFGTAGGGSGLATRHPNRDAAVRGIILALTRNRVTLRRRNGYVITMDEGRALANRASSSGSYLAKTV